MALDYERMEAASTEAGRLLRVLGNPHRLMILCQLAEGEKSAGELAARVDLAQSAFSQHLARLRSDGLVATRREAQRVFYALRDPKALRLIRVLHDIYCAPHGAAPERKETLR